MKLLNTLIVLVLTFFSVSILNADVYVWTDEKGVKHYSDHPPENVDDYEIQKDSQPIQNNEETNSEQTDAEQKHNPAVSANHRRGRETAAGRETEG